MMWPRAIVVCRVLAALGLWQLQTGPAWAAEEPRVLRAGGWIGGLATSPDCRWLAAGCSDRAAHVWLLDSGQEVLRLEGHRDAVKAVAFSPDGRTLATGS